jgi:hypothetical protein
VWSCARCSSRVAYAAVVRTITILGDSETGTEGRDGTPTPVGAVGAADSAPEGVEFHHVRGAECRVADVVGVDGVCATSDVEVALRLRWPLRSQRRKRRSWLQRRMRMRSGKASSPVERWPVRID